MDLIASANFTPGRLDRLRRIDGAKVRMARYSKGLSLFSVASVSGLSLSTCDRAESGAATLRTLKRLAAVLGVSPSELEVAEAGQAQVNEFTIGEQIR